MKSSTLALLVLMLGVALVIMGVTGRTKAILKSLSAP